MLKNVPKYCLGVYCLLIIIELFVLLAYSFTFLFTFIYTSHQKMSIIKTFLTDSQPGYVLSMFLKLLLISAWTLL